MTPSSRGGAVTGATGSGSVNYLIKKHVRRTKKKTHSGKEDRDERSRPQKSLLRNSSVLELRSRRTIRRRKPNPICRHIYLLKNAHPEAVNVEGLGPGIHRLPSTFMPSVFRGITRLDLITSQNLTLYLSGFKGNMHRYALIQIT
jgi:hypothetical protein